MNAIIKPAGFEAGFFYQNWPFVHIFSHERVMKVNDSNKTDFAVLGGGCFWCIEAVFSKTKGVLEAISGYAGGESGPPTYEQVSTGITGHAEVVRVEYNPAVISFESLLELFFKAHNPTTPNRQGADIGTQYRSIILYNDDRQKKLAEQAIEKAGVDYKTGIVTELKPLSEFYRAEEYHQHYYMKNPSQGYCTVVIRPKMNKLGLE